MRKVLTCTACGARLSEPLVIASGKDPSVSQPEYKDGEPLTARGIAFKSYEPIERSYGAEPALLEFAPQHWLNPDDLNEAVRLTGDDRRLNGCCGIAGLDGPNQLCRCGAEVGTVRTDCWTPLVFIPVPDATLWLEQQ